MLQKSIQRNINKSNLTVLTMIETLKVSSRGQIVIPEELRKELGIKEGTKLILIKEENRIIIEKEAEFLKRLKGIDKEKAGWLALAEKSLEKMWDNKKDDEIWKKYL